MGAQLRSQDEGPGGPEESDPANKGKSPEVLEKEKRILEIFSASEKRFSGEKVVLVYNFESKKEDLVEDWKPALDPKNSRIRWARGLEGTYTTVEDGIILADAGEWMHEALFLPDLEVDVDVLPVSQHKPGNIMAVVFHNDKKKRDLGDNTGGQVVCLSARKHAKPPIPAEERKVSANNRFQMGYKFDGKVFQSRMGPRKTADTTAAPKFTEGFDGGRVGLVWSGSVQYFLFKVTIKGKLDPAWVAKQLGESTQTASKKKDAGPTSATKKAGDTGKTGDPATDPSKKKDAKQK